MVSADESIAMARRWAEFYRGRGFNPLPSRPDAKRPFIRYADAWQTGMSKGIFDRFPTTNIQLMTGRHWRLLVIDLDGHPAREQFASMGPSVPLTWITHSGGDGLHLWFSLPSDLRRPIPKAILWEGTEKHSKIERLCDRSLIMVPPSIHPTTKRRYRFLDRAHSPARLPMPALCPSWVLGLKAADKSEPRPTFSLSPSSPVRRVTTTTRYRAADVLAAIPDKVGVAKGWGLRVASMTANSSGWCSCHAIDREDRTPSAAISQETGRYWEAEIGTIGFFDLAVQLGIYSEWRDAVADLGSRYGAMEAVA